MSRRRSKWAEGKRGRAASYSGQFVGRLCEMLESPAFRVLTSPRTACSRGWKSN
jgi:hypothetical protein